MDITQTISVTRRMDLGHLTVHLRAQETCDVSPREGHLRMFRHAGILTICSNRCYLNDLYFLGSLTGKTQK
jgi:hypothetical protein